MATLTVYPDPHTETTSFDGWAEVFNIDWATAHDATISASFNDSGTSYSTLITTDKGVFYTITRFFTLFDTSALGSGATISAATWSVAANGGTKANADSQDIDLVSSNPASNTSIAGDDYDQVGTTVYGSLAVSSWVDTNNTYNNISLNASGLAAISKTGITKFAARLSRDTDNTAPTGNGYVGGYMADNTGTSSDPKLVITYTGATTTPKPKPTLLTLGVG